MIAVDQNALDRAIDFLGLEWPVKVVLNSRRSYTRAHHGLRYFETKIVRRRIVGIDASPGPYHRIMLKSWLIPHQASRSLWHELAHAMQAERAARAAGAKEPREIYDAWSNYIHKDNGGIDYENKPMEVEARDHSRYAATHPLVIELSTR